MKGQRKSPEPCLFLCTHFNPPPGTMGPFLVQQIQNQSNRCAGGSLRSPWRRPIRCSGSAPFPKKGFPSVRRQPFIPSLLRSSLLFSLCLRTRRLMEKVPKNVAITWAWKKGVKSRKVQTIGRARVLLVFLVHIHTHFGVRLGNRKLDHVWELQPNYHTIHGRDETRFGCTRGGSQLCGKLS